MISGIPIKPGIRSKLPAQWVCDWMTVTVAWWPNYPERDQSSSGWVDCPETEKKKKKN